ncbi:unnamed protein product [Cylicocyclus nassatus]|uniref:Uncharacterized protein n=1 Tax=Cylicocyclus nassatus TaxID=53992 RepID=A0AA36DQV6_CYLNA|nr:unnamed protein product [Cylicocyclus nassatus]
MSLHNEFSKNIIGVHKILKSCLVHKRKYKQQSSFREERSRSVIPRVAAKLEEIAYKVMLFERATFLVIAHAEVTKHRDMHRFEKVSNIIKQFKLSCSKMGSQFEYMHVRNSHFAAFIDAFTPNTFIMVVLADGNNPDKNICEFVMRDSIVVRVF